ncbi:hypothetical protein P692DRAFT_201916784 [Suillus brevipes Sb2]|nr:hypothetical protein P692DRAFT_201916784 [Suillus brevipes Sb2]
MTRRSVNYTATSLGTFAMRLEAHQPHQGSRRCAAKCKRPVPLRHPQPGSPSLQTLAPNKHAKPSSPSSAIRLPQPPLRKLLHSSRTDAVRNLLDFPATAPLPPSSRILLLNSSHRATFSSLLLALTTLSLMHLSLIIYSLLANLIGSTTQDDTYISSLAAMGEMTQRYSSTVDPGAETIYTRFNSQWRGCTQVQDRRQTAVTATGT